MNLKEIDPFANDAYDNQPSAVDEPVSHMFGVGSVRKVLARWWLLLIFGALGYTAALYYMSIAPTKSEAMAVLEVDIKMRQVMGAELETDRLTPELVLATTANKLSSPGILAKVASSPEVQALPRLIPPAFSLKPRYWRTEEELAFAPATSVDPAVLLAKISKSWVTISSRRNTSLIDVSVKHPDAESARAIADTILRIFMQEEEASKSGGMATVVASIKAEADSAHEDLDEARKSLQVYVTATKLSEQIQQARAELINLRQRYKAKHPMLRQFTTVYKDLNTRFHREIERAANTESEKGFWLTYREQLDDLKGKIEAEGDSIGEAADEWLTVAQNALATRGNLLIARVAQGQQSYDRMMQRLTELDVGEQDQSDQFKIIQPAFVALSTDSFRLIYLGAGTLLGMASGFALAFILGVMDYKIYDVRSLEEITGLKCMAVLPYDPAFSENKDEAWHSVIEKDQNSMNAEAVRNLRASIVMLGQKHRHKILLIASATPSEGKTTVASELASSFAMSNERTLLVGMDLRKPRMDQLFPKYRGKPGLTDVMAGQAELKDCVYSTDHENLYVMISGTKCSNPSELLHEEELRNLFDKLAANFERIVIDTAPLLPVSDTRIIAKFAQTVILVVRARNAPVGAVMRSIQMLQRAGKEPAGVVMNGMKKGKSIVSYGYYGYGGYGEYNSEYYGSDEKKEK